MYGFSYAIDCFLGLDRHGIPQQALQILKIALQYITSLINVMDFSVFEFLLRTLRKIRHGGHLAVAHKLREEFVRQAHVMLPAGDMRKLLYEDIVMIDLGRVRLLEGAASQCMEAVRNKHLHPEWHDPGGTKRTKLLIQNARGSTTEQEMSRILDQHLLEGSQEAAIVMFAMFDDDKSNSTAPGVEMLEEAIEHFYLPLGRLDEANTVVRFLIR